MDIKKFKSAEFERRTAPVPVPGLSAFFDDSKKAEFIVQGLTGEEVAKARERVNQNKSINELIESVLSKKTSDKVRGIQQALGIGKEVPDDLAYRIALCEFGVVSVHLEQEDCVKLAAVCPVAFYEVTSKILELTGIGQVHPGESNASGTRSE